MATFLDLLYDEAPLAAFDEHLARSEAGLPEDEAALTPDQELLFEALRSWRKQQADERALAAYMIFDNKTLRGIARMRPNSPEQLAEVKGVGQTKLETYGSAVLDLVAAEPVGQGGA